MHIASLFSPFSARPLLPQKMVALRENRHANSSPNAQLEAKKAQPFLPGWIAVRPTFGQLSDGWRFDARNPDVNLHLLSQNTLGMNGASSQSALISVSMDSFQKGMQYANQDAKMAMATPLAPAIHFAGKADDKPTRVDYPIVLNRLDQSARQYEMQVQKRQHPDLVALNKIRQQCVDVVRDAGLTPVDVDFTVVPHDQLLRTAARNGFPERYPHWSWGQEYFTKYKMPHAMRQMPYAEVVTPGNPVQAYLPDNEPNYARKVRIFQALARSDFYRNNAYFQKNWNPRLSQEVTAHAAYVRNVSTSIAEQVKALTEHLEKRLPDELFQQDAFLDVTEPLVKLAQQTQAGTVPQTMLAYKVGDVLAQTMSPWLSEPIQRKDVFAEAATIANHILSDCAHANSKTLTQRLAGELADSVNRNLFALTLKHINAKTGVDEDKIEAFVRGQLTAQALGDETVEEFLDQAHTVRNLVDISQGMHALESENTPTRLHPEHDVLGYIIHHSASLKPWQKDLADIVRRESFALMPQLKTEIMASGWAAFWNEKLNVQNPLLWDTRNLTRALTWSSQRFKHDKVKVNPYQLGYVMFQTIEKNLQQKYANASDKDEKVRNELLRIRRENDDVSFLRRYLTKPMVEALQLYNYDPKKKNVNAQEEGTKLFISPDEFDAIRERLIEMSENAGQPLIHVVADNFDQQGSLLLHHAHAYDLKRDYAEKTLTNLAKLWGKPVYLETRMNDRLEEKKPTIIFSNGKSTFQKPVRPTDPYYDALQKEEKLQETLRKNVPHSGENTQP